jgi:DNA repair protein RecO (recombination protein O)
LASLSADAIVCAVRAHGEHGAILRALTHEAGLVAGYVRGGRSRRLRPILMPGNRVALELRSRTEEQLGGATVELLESRAPLLGEPLAAAAIDWVTSLTVAVLPEGQPFPALYIALSAVLEAIGVAPSARQWALALGRYELLLLAELGFGLEDKPRAASSPSMAEMLDFLSVTGHFIDRDLLDGRNRALAGVRQRLIDRLGRVVA